MTANQKFGFDIRIVRYEKIHGIRSVDFNNLTNAIDIKNGQTILDVGAGYGAVTREIVKRNPTKELKFYLSEISKVQLQRAKHEMSKYFIDSCFSINLRLEIDDIVNSKFKNSFFNRVIAKMVIHEIKKEEQQSALNEIYRVLKPKGKLIIWDIVLSKDIQTLIQSVIRKKDEIAGFHDLVNNRYLLREDEIKKLIKNAKFNQTKIAAYIPYNLNTYKRLDAEFKGDKKKLYEWNDFIRNEIDNVRPEIKKSILINDDGQNISLRFKKAILTCQKS